MSYSEVAGYCQHMRATANQVVTVAIGDLINAAEVFYVCEVCRIFTPIQFVETPDLKRSTKR